MGGASPTTTTTGPSGGVSRLGAGNVTDSLIDAGAQSLERDRALRERAERVIPGGMYGHMRVSIDRMPPSYPQYYARGRGARLWDADGNEYIDFQCGFGPMIAGYANPVIDDAAIEQVRAGDTFSGPTSRMVELAELLVDTVHAADWAMFAKNGTDVTSMATVVARAATGREKLLKARVAYHGANAWFTPMLAGVTTADRADIVEYEYNDIASLRAAAAEHEGNIAAIIVTPFKHEAFTDQEEVDPAFAHAARELATANGAVLILDEVRTAMRLDMAGAWESIGVRPDLTAFSKSVANGYPLAVLTGIDALRGPAQEVYVTGSFWYQGAPMAAAIATLTLLKEIDGVGIMSAMGQRLRNGLAAQAQAHGLGLKQTGPTQMPMVLFADDPKFQLGFAFADAAVRRGVLLHPWHNMFLSAAHTEDDIDEALEKTDSAFAEVTAAL